MTILFTVLFGLLLGVLRIVGFVDPLFQAVAHLYMGGLTVAWFYQPQWLNWQWWLFWTLNVVEVTMAVVTRL